MTVMVLEKVPASLRGELSRWLIEPATGVFVGRLSGMVRDRLWEKCKKKARGGRVLQAWSSNNEQGFTIRTHGDSRREIVDFEGLQLVKVR